MKTFYIAIEGYCETLLRVYKVEANTKSEAYEKAKELYLSDLTIYETTEKAYNQFQEEIGEDEDLPESIKLDRNTIEENYINVYDNDKLVEDLEEYLTNTYDYCVKNFEYECVWDKLYPDQIHYILIHNIEWDTTE